MRLRLTILGLLLLSAIQIATAQTMDVSGVVKDTQGSPVIGASVAINGDKIVAITDADGKFVAKGVKNSDVLVFKYLGMVTQKMKAKRNLQVIMEDDTKALDETIVVAFGKEKRSAFTGSASVVGTEVLEKRQVTNALSALNGEVAGLQMIDNSGDPAATPTIRIRGYSSINAGNDPLIILDGAPFDGGINNINPNDIANVTVLKDAASNALYGARGANGVIMITTKSAAKGEGKTTFNLDVKLGANSNAAVDYDYIDNPGEYYEMFYKSVRNQQLALGKSAYEAHKIANERIYDTTGNTGLGYVVYSVPNGEYLIGENGKLNPHATLGNTIPYNGEAEYTLLPDDWTDAALRTALRQEYNLSISSSLKDAQVYASLGYLNNEGIARNSSYERYSARIKADWDAKKWLKVGANASFTHAIQDYISDSDDGTGLFYTLRNMSPIYPLYIRDANGNIMTDKNGAMYDYGDGQVIGLIRKTLTKTNNIQENAINTNETTYNNFSLNGFADITPFEGLKITLNGTVNGTFSRGTYTYNPFYGYTSTQYVNGGVSKSQSQNYSVNFQQLVNYTKDFGEHIMTLLLGHENYKTRYDYLYGSKQNMASYYGNQNLSGAISVIDVTDYNSSSTAPAADYNNEGWFFRGQYDYADKYFGSVSFRRDASSRFHPDHRWGSFYSIGGAWILNKEDWFNSTWVDQLKLKASIGQQGNDQIGENRYQDLYSVVNNAGELGLNFYQKGNKDITWETNTNLNIGVEFSLFKGRLTGGVEYFRRHTTDMLTYVYVPYELGYAGYYANVGSMDNNGVELDLTGILIKNNVLTWSVNLNATHFKNEVKELESSIKTTVIDGHAGYMNGSKFIGEGLSIYEWYLKKYAGVNENGQATWYTSDGGTTTVYGDADYMLCGSAIPDVYGGFGTSLSAYGFDFSISFNYSIGGKAYDSMYALLMTNPYEGYTGYSLHKDLYNAWTEENTNTNIPRFNFGDTDVASQSSRFLTNASYLTLRNINLGYTLPTRLVSKLGLSKVRIYGSADNLCYWSKRKGFDPRGAFSGSISANTYSPMKSISCGVNIQF